MQRHERRANAHQFLLARTRAHTYVSHFLMQAVPRCAALLRDGRAYDRTVVEGSEFSACITIICSPSMALMR